jgi:lipoprotein-anchoring transpeptidase ErfK/SrfK
MPAKHSSSRNSAAAYGACLLLSLAMATPSLAASQVRQFDARTGTWTMKQVDNAALERRLNAAPIPPQIVPYAAAAPGTIVVDTTQRRLFLVQAGGTAISYLIGVGREGFAWKGTEKISRKAEWPGWTPPGEMRRREAARGRVLPAYMEGGPENPLGARALYLGSTLFRVHGTNEPWTLGQAVSSGCIRMANDDVMDLYDRVRIGTVVIVK